MGGIVADLSKDGGKLLGRLRRAEVGLEVAADGLVCGVVNRLPFTALLLLIPDRVQTARVCFHFHSQQGTGLCFLMPS